MQWMDAYTFQNLLLYIKVYDVVQVKSPAVKGLKPTNDSPLLFNLNTADSFHVPLKEYWQNIFYKSI